MAARAFIRLYHKGNDVAGIYTLPDTRMNEKEATRKRRSHDIDQ